MSVVDAVLHGRRFDGRTVTDRTPRNVRLRADGGWPGEVQWIMEHFGLAPGRTYIADVVEVNRFDSTLRLRGMPPRTRVNASCFEVVP